ncbi:MAG TPA: AlpA family phage regulatory protein [Proteobacteria bacterium]|nr:prophage CP4-57 regulatory protein [bacterium BMS3Abin14]HDL52595.1 AlpA family phage regulatory protein [Pseudomonadota bacterium]
MKSERVLSPKKLAQELGIARSSLYRLRVGEPSFPKPIRLSERRVGWRESEVQAWIESRPRVATGSREK